MYVLFFILRLVKFDFLPIKEFVYRGFNVRFDIFTAEPLDSPKFPFLAPKRFPLKLTNDNVLFNHKLYKFKLLL